MSWWQFIFSISMGSTPLAMQKMLLRNPRSDLLRLLLWKLQSSDQFELFPTRMPALPIGRHISNAGGSFSSGGGGINVCCCRICTCVNFGFLSSRFGLMKLFEVLLASFCETLLVQFGIPYASNIGKALFSFQAATASTYTTTVILLIVYCFSEKSFYLVRQSLFETLFNGISCFMYASASSYMATTTILWLYPQFLIVPGFIAYPAMVAVYWMGYIAAIIYGFDAYSSYKHYKGRR